jgi:hypothetical protein
MDAAAALHDIIVRRIGRIDLFIDDTTTTSRTDWG